MAYAYNPQPSTSGVGARPMVFFHPAASTPRIVSSRFTSPTPQAQIVYPVNPTVVWPVPGFFLNRAILVLIGDQRSRVLFQLMVHEGLLPLPEEEGKRWRVIERLKQIVLAWINRVAYQKSLLSQHFTAYSATVLAYGSYGLGVHTSESDIDALCVGPYFVSLAEDFFIVLRDMLRCVPEVSEINCVKDAKIPLMRFKFEGISVDFPFVRLSVTSVPEKLDVFHPYIAREIDDVSWKCLSGVCVNIHILQLVPNVEKFRAVLRCVKLWAKRRGIYGNLFGFLGGVHLAILTAFVCQTHQMELLSTSISKFFETFASWPWPNPVRLQDGTPPFSWSPTEARSYMPINLPCSPEYCHSNITFGTYNKIQMEFKRAHRYTQDLSRADFQWEELFRHFPYRQIYSYFLKILLSALSPEELTDWAGFVKSRFPGLLLKVEEEMGSCDPIPTEYRDANIAEAHVVFYWGLTSRYIDEASLRDYFWRGLHSGIQRVNGRMEMWVVDSAQLPDDMQVKSGSMRGCPTVGQYAPRRVPGYQQHAQVYVTHPQNHVNPMYMRNLG